MQTGDGCTHFKLDIGKNILALTRKLSENSLVRLDGSNMKGKLFPRLQDLTNTTSF